MFVDDANLNDQIPPEEIPFMHYGIINQHNYSKIEDVPIKRWDPLTFNPIILSNSGHSIELSKTYGHYSYISPIRAVRPVERKKKSEDNAEGERDKEYMGSVDDIESERNIGELLDIFEPMVNGEHYIFNSGRKVAPAHTLILADGSKRMDDPFSENVRIYRNLKGRAMSMINKYPAMVRVIDDEIKPRVNKELREMDMHAKIAQGVCFLTIPRHYHENIEDMTVEELTDFFITTQTAINYVIETVREKRDMVIPISPFFNVGKAVGGSLRRLHMQVYMDLTEDGHGSRMESILKAFANMEKKQYCHICKSNHGDGRRVIIENEDWTVFATNSPIRNYHLRFAPKRHIEKLEDVSMHEFRALAKILTITSMVLNDLGVNPNRNIIFNTRPHGYKSYFHLFGEILPFENIGGAEMADDMRVVRISPQIFAADAKKIITEKKYEKLL